MMHRDRPWSTLVKDVAVFGVAFGLANLVSYLYLVVAGRTLAPAQFGVFSALLGVVGIFGFLVASLQLALTQAAAADPSRAAFAALMRGAWRIAVPGVTLLTFASIPFAGAIGASVGEVVAAGVAILSIVIAGTPMAFLAALARLRLQAGINLLGALVRLGTGWLLMTVGVGITGGVLGYLWNYMAILALAWWASWHLARRRSPDEKSGIQRLRLDPSSVATFVLAFAPFSLDQLLVQAFSPALGSSYAGASTVAKLVFFGAYPVIAVAYPHLLTLSEGRDRTRLAVLAVAGVAGIAVVLALGLIAFPDRVMALFFDGRFGEAAPYVAPLALGVCAFALSLTGAHLLVAWGGRYGFVSSLAAICVGVALFALRHDSLATLVANQVWIYGLQLVLVSISLAATVGRSAARRRASATEATEP